MYNYDGAFNDLGLRRLRRNLEEVKAGRLPDNIRMISKPSQVSLDAMRAALEKRIQELTGE